MSTAIFIKQTQHTSDDTDFIASKVLELKKKITNKKRCKAQKVAGKKQGGNEQRCKSKIL